MGSNAACYFVLHQVANKQVPPPSSPKQAPPTSTWPADHMFEFLHLLLYRLVGNCLHYASLQQSIFCLAWYLIGYPKYVSSHLLCLFTVRFSLYKKVSLQPSKRCLVRLTYRLHTAYQASSDSRNIFNSFQNCQLPTNCLLVWLSAFD